MYLEDQAASADFQIGGRLISRNEELKIAAKIGREASKTPPGRYTACYHARFCWMRVYYVQAALFDPNDVHSF